MTASRLSAPPIDVGAAIDWTDASTDDEDTLLGRLTIYGTPHHVMAIRVTRTQSGVQVATKDPYKRLDDAYALDPDGCYQTTEIPNQTGRWVLVMHPYAT